MMAVKVTSVNKKNQVSNNVSSQSVVYPTEREYKENEQQKTTTIMSKLIISNCGSIAFRAVPLYLKSGN